MLLLDEIQVRERKAVNSKTLSYTGLVDHGDTDQQSSELANHGLVFMLCPFGESYAQLVAVFDSRYATKGTVLCQLLLQAITMLEGAGALIDGIVCD